MDFTGRPVDKSILEKMTNTLCHRGPDDHGVYSNGNLGLGHRRLSIIDLSPLGHQPMPNDDGSIWVVFNGEIYNFMDLRSELISLGHSFISNSDTEVIIKGYEQWGQSCWDKLDGMFSIALWDGRKGVLHLVRDPFGIKPLYYHYKNGVVIFASEIKSILVSGMVSKELNYGSLSDYLTYFYTPGPETIVRDIYHVRPGHVMSFDSTESKEFQYWELKTDGSLKDAKLEDLMELARLECREAVRKSLVSDVPVGLLLSSGLDSNIILSELIETGYPDIQTITVGFRAETYNETSIVERRLSELPIKNRIVYLEDQNIADMFDHMVYHMDSLSANVGNIAEYMIVREAGKYVKVALAGAGNDELFAGYSTYLADRVRTYYNKVPTFMQSGFRKLVESLPHSDRKYGFDYILRKFTQGAGYSPQKSHYWWRTIFTDEDKSRLFNTQAKGFERDLLRDGFLHYKSRYDEVESIFDFETQSLYADFALFCNENANSMVDNLSMAFALEIRPPFLTKRFVEFAFKVPYKYKLRGLTTKYFLRKAYEGRIPGYITGGRKTGLVSPIPQLIRGQLKDMVLDTFADLNRFPFINREYAMKMLDEHIGGGKDHGFQIYVLFTFMRWHSIFIDSDR